MNYPAFAAWSSSVLLIGFALGRLTHLTLWTPSAMAATYCVGLLVRRATS
jgi:hypothetical protein